MKTKSIQLVLRKFTFDLIIFLFLLVSSFAFAKDPSSSKTVRVAVKTNVPLTHAIVDELGQYGKVGHKMWKLNIVDMRISLQNLSTLRSLPFVKYVEKDQAMTLGPIETALLTLDDSSNFSEGCSTWNLDIINVTEFISNGESGCSGKRDERVEPYDGTGIYVAVVDSGLTSNWRDYYLEESIVSDLAKTIIGGPALDNPSASDHAMTAEPENLWEHDTNSHGTIVTAPILGFRINHVYPNAPIVNGIAPGAKIIPVKYQNNNTNGSGSIFDVVAALEYVGSLREDGIVTAPMVVNLSSGWTAPSQALEDAADYLIAQDIIVVANAGNQSQRFPGSSTGDEMWWPGAYPQVISVGASGAREIWQPFVDSNNFNLFWFLDDVDSCTDENSSAFCSDEGDQSYVAFFSSRAVGPQCPDPFCQELDLVAPGDQLFLPYLSRGGAAKQASSPGCEPGIGNGDCPLDYRYRSGSSLAAPHVAGIAALLLQKNLMLGNPDLTQTQVECILKNTTIKIPAGTHTDPLYLDFSEWGTEASEQGSGLVQADKALDCIGPGGDLSSCGCQ